MSNMDEISISSVSELPHGTAALIRSIDSGDFEDITVTTVHTGVWEALSLIEYKVVISLKNGLGLTAVILKDFDDPAYTIDEMSGSLVGPVHYFDYDHVIEHPERWGIVV